MCLDLVFRTIAVVPVSRFTFCCCFVFLIFIAGLFLFCTPYNHAPYHVTSYKATYAGSVHACLAVTCHLHFWQNDRDLLCATAVTRGWNRYRNKSQHRKLILEKKILPLLLQGFEPTTF